MESRREGETMNDMKELIEQLKDMNYQLSKIRTHLQGMEELMMDRQK